MRAVEKRVKTMVAVLRGTTGFNGNPVETAQICSEYLSISKASQVSNEQLRHLLLVFHAVRAFDNSLAIFTDYYGCMPVPPGIGKCLHALHSHSLSVIGKLDITLRDRYIRSIAVERNKYLHKASAYPADYHAVVTLLTEIDSCLTDISRL
jgi:hypothetical protein